MANEKLKESIVRAACDTQYFFDVWNHLQARMPGYNDKLDALKLQELRRMQDERNDASASFVSCRAQLFRMVKKLKEKEPEYDE